MGKTGFFHRLRLSLLFALLVFIIMVLSILIILFSFLIFLHLGMIDENSLRDLPFIHFAISCLITGVFLSLLFSHRPLKPLYEIMNATDRVAGGDYSVQVHIDRPEEFRQLSESFNHMVKEINSVEMLRTDFVNNFSHEFKTPIVSIRGFARLLKQEDLTPEEREEYLTIIINETERLAALSSNVLELSRLEQQSIITDRRRLNITEQIRLAIALLDPKWSDREIEIDFECPEIYIDGNEELLRQVWINLLDNAYKFSPRHGVITIRIRQSSQTTITFENHSLELLTPEICEHVFEKFYQGDPSHTHAGNGLGLAIARQILVLHGGSIELTAPAPDTACFTIRLPG